MTSTIQPLRIHPQLDRPASDQYQQVAAGRAGQGSAKLHPKEHGAYAILGIPIVTSLLISGLTISGGCVAIAAVAGFLAHEPLLVAWGRRGRRAQQSTPAARKRLSVLLPMISMAGTVALVLGSPQERWALLACLAFALFSFSIAKLGWHRTLAGQLAGVAGLTVPCVPILLAGGMETSQAITVWAVWLIAFVATTLGVRSVIAAQKRQPRYLHLLILTALTLPVTAGLLLDTSWAMAVVPMMLLSWYLLIAPPNAKYLKRVGWASVAITLVTAGLMIEIFRL